MAEETKQASPQWSLSPSYRIVHSNFFRYRINTGELALHFDSVTDLGPAATTPTLIGEVSVAMSWSQGQSADENPSATGPDHRERNWCDSHA
jgi:hypothetical protein